MTMGFCVLELGMTWCCKSCHEEDGTAVKDCRALDRFESGSMNDCVFTKASAYGKTRYIMVRIVEMIVWKPTDG